MTIWNKIEKLTDSPLLRDRNRHYTAVRVTAWIIGLLLLGYGMGFYFGAR